MIIDLITIVNICIVLLACAVVWLAVAQIKINPQNKRVMIVFICLALGMGGLTALVDIKRTAYEEKLLKQMLESQNEILGLRNKMRDLEEQTKNPVENTLEDKKSFMGEEFWASDPNVEKLKDYGGPSHEFVEYDEQKQE